MIESHKLATLRVMLQAQLRVMEHSLEGWREVNQSGAHDLIVGDRQGRIAQLNDTLQAIEELTK